MNKSSETITAKLNPEAAFYIELNTVPWQPEVGELREAFVTRQTPLLVMRELESRGRPESALHD